ncbi:MAG: bifunctional salicylyl-CoA 5-hydroxylase/oxidoreductase [Deltaproteobacteria bacterium]|nr:bifunctional salicylyl-CoA 5-hydroxylase/oxidoreductase [Deltaproteobacteria bacterium]
MKVVCLGGGPAGLFTAALLKQADPRHQVRVYEQNRADDAFGFGVVFSDATEEAIAKADPLITDAMGRHAHRWDDIEIHYGGDTLISSGHGFSGLSRKTMLALLQEHCRAVDVELVFGSQVDDPAGLTDADLVVAADGVGSRTRERYREHFRPSIDERPNRFVWLGTTRPFPAFTFYFKHNDHGMWRVHAYQYEPGASTFIVETTDAAWRAAGLESATEAQTLAYCEHLFAAELEGHRLIGNRSIWRRFPVIRNERWHHNNVVLLGDAAHTAHFSVGSGTKLAMEDAIALVLALQEHRSVADALPAYQEARRPAVESLQRAAQVSMQWFEDAERYMTLEPLQFAFSLLTRSMRVTHENLRVRDHAFVERVDDWFAARAARAAGAEPSEEPTPPMFTPLKLRSLLLENRVAVSPMCQYSAVDGMPNDWHLVHYGSRAVGGAGLLFTEMTDVSADGRISPGCTGLYQPEHVVGWRRITDFVHQHSRAKIAVQLGHAGRKASTNRGWEGDNVPLQVGGWPIVAASPVPYLQDSPVPRELDAAGMKLVVADFVRAARMADDAGFDLLELHMAHGYLLASFLSPLTNQRTDEYGGDLTRRMRFPLEVFDAVRDRWPASKPMSVRVSAVDWAEGGMRPEDAVEIARALGQHGCDIVDVSAGQTVAHQQPAYGRLFQTPFADRVRQESGLRTMAVGNITSFTDVNTILAAGRADLCLLARAHLFDPYWTRHAAVELGYPLRWPDPYNAIERYRPRFT